MSIRNPRLFAVAGAAALSAVAIGITIVERTHTEEAIAGQAVTNCRAIEDLKAAITDVLRDGRDRVVARRGELDPTVYRQSLDYYDRQLARFQPKEC